MFKKYYFHPILLPFFLMISLTSCKDDQAEVEIIRPVRTEQVFSTGGTRVRTFSGVLKSGSESKLSFKVPGTVQEVAVDIGSRVRKGNILARLDPTDYEI